MSSTTLDWYLDYLTQPISYYQFPRAAITMFLSWTHRRDWYLVASIFLKAACSHCSLHNSKFPVDKSNSGSHWRVKGDYQYLTCIIRYYTPAVPTQLHRAYVGLYFFPRLKFRVTHPRLAHGRWYGYQTGLLVFRISYAKHPWSEAIKFTHGFAEVSIKTSEQREYLSSWLRGFCKSSLHCINC